MNNKVFTKKVVIGDFVHSQTLEGTWMISDIAFNYELKVHQAKIIRVGNPRHAEMVDPETLSMIPRSF